MLSKVERAVVASELGTTPPVLSIRSRTRVDAGRWWWGTRLWLLVMEDELVVFAASRRRYFCRIPFIECCETHYCHNTGELVIAPAEDLEFRNIAMPPSKAMQVMHLLGIDI